jgi:hypothetical protein
MNYQFIYNQLIERGQFRIKPEGYFEKHHIIPKCIKGNNSPENLVNLTAREHFLCHWLLCRIYPENSSLSAAFWLMCISKGNSHKRYVPSSKIYEEARISFSHHQSILMKKDKIRINKIKNAWKNKSKKELKEYGKTLSNIFYNKSEKEKKIISEKRSLSFKNQTTEKKINSFLKKKNTWKNKTKEEFEEYENKISLKNSKPILQFDLQGNFIREWSSITEVDLLLHCDAGACARGHQQTAGGFKWKYKNE